MRVRTCTLHATVAHRDGGPDADGRAQACQEDRQRRQLPRVLLPPVLPDLGQLHRQKGGRGHHHQQPPHALGQVLHAQHGRHHGADHDRRPADQAAPRRPVLGLRHGTRFCSSGGGGEGGGWFVFSRWVSSRTA